MNSLCYVKKQAIKYLNFLALKILYPKLEIEERLEKIFNTSIFRGGIRSLRGAARVFYFLISQKYGTLLKDMEIREYVDFIHGS